MVILIGNGVLKPNDVNSLSELGGEITLTDILARRVLKSMDLVKRKETTRKVEPSTGFLAEEKFTFQRAISTAISIFITMKSLLTLLSTLIRHLCYTYPLERINSTLKVLKTFP